MKHVVYRIEIEAIVLMLFAIQSLSLSSHVTLFVSPNSCRNSGIDENRHFRLSLENEKSDFNSVNDMLHCSVTSCVQKQLKN